MDDDLNNQGSPTNLTDHSVEALGLSPRTLAAIIRLHGGDLTIGDLTAFSHIELLDAPRLGEKTLKEIERQLDQHGLSLSRHRIDEPGRIYVLTAAKSAASQTLRSLPVRMLSEYRLRLIPELHRMVLPGRPNAALSDFLETTTVGALVRMNEGDITAAISKIFISPKSQADLRKALGDIRRKMMQSG